MTQFTTICVWFAITLIIGVVTFFFPGIFLGESKTYSREHFIVSWIYSTLIAGILLTVLLIQNGLLQW